MEEEQVKGILCPDCGYNKFHLMDHGDHVAVECARCLCRLRGLDTSWFEDFPRTGDLTRTEGET